MCQLCNGYKNVVYKWATKIPQLWNHRRVNQWPQSAVIATASLLTAPHEQWLNSLADKWAVFKAWLANKWLGFFLSTEAMRDPTKEPCPIWIYLVVFLVCPWEMKLKWLPGPEVFFLAIALNILAGRQVLLGQMPRLCGSHGCPFTGKRGGILQRSYTNKIVKAMAAMIYCVYHVLELKVLKNICLWVKQCCT